MKLLKSMSALLLASIMSLGVSSFVFASEVDNNVTSIQETNPVEEVSSETEPTEDYILVVFDDGTETKLYKMDTNEKASWERLDYNGPTPRINLNNVSRYLTTTTITKIGGANNVANASVKVTLNSGPGSAMVWPDGYNPVQMVAGQSATFYYPWNYGYYNIDAYAAWNNGTYYFTVKD